MKHTISAIAAMVDGEVQGDGNFTIDGIGSLDKAKLSQLSFCVGGRYRKMLANTKAGVVLLPKALVVDCNTNAIVCKDPYLAYAKVTKLFVTAPEVATGIHASAVIAETAEIDASAKIAANVVIGPRSKVAANVVIEAGVIIGADCSIASGTHLKARVTLNNRVTIGKYCLVQSGAVLGSDGFGYANEHGQWVKIEQLGAVVVGDNVEIGANTTIDCGAINDTIIGNGVIIDNQVQIAHNVIIGDYTAIAGCVGIAGETTIGKYCRIGGACIIGGKLEIADQVAITGGSALGKSITEPGKVYSSGMPAIENRKWRRNVAVMQRLGELNPKARALIFEEEV